MWLCVGRPSLHPTENRQRKLNSKRFIDRTIKTPQVCVALVWWNSLTLWAGLSLAKGNRWTTGLNPQMYCSVMRRVTKELLSPHGSLCKQGRGCGTAQVQGKGTDTSMAFHWRRHLSVFFRKKLLVLFTINKRRVWIYRAMQSLPGHFLWGSIVWCLMGAVMRHYTRKRANAHNLICQLKARFKNQYEVSFGNHVLLDHHS